MASKAPRAGKKPVRKTTASKPKATSPAVTEAASVEPVKSVVAEPAAKAAEAAVETVETVVEPVVAAPIAEEVAETAAPAAAPARKIIEDTAPEMAETVAKGTELMEAIEKTQAMFADMNDRAKAAVEKNTKLVGEMTDFAKGNVEALVESGKIAAKGLETIGQDAAEYSRKSFESATAAMKSLAAVKSPADFFKLQSDYLRSSFDAVVAETSKNTEAMIKLAGDAAQPVSSRFAVAMDKVKAAA
ncbi:phasin family protein [Sphingomonas sp.]|uniref:phasin family protein n=1 Tax=Sphingomonas sp. TaxID=28214 RepID=UPI001ED53E80|nr:phasin family protein [Sphingomonas sp.]MBX3593159.1 phasin family protein [Sphingomonas sp.]